MGMLKLQFEIIISMSYHVYIFLSSQDCGLLEEFDMLKEFAFFLKLVSSVYV